MNVEAIIRVAIGRGARKNLEGVASIIASEVASHGDRRRAVRLAIDSGCGWDDINTVLSRLEAAGVVEERRVKPSWRNVAAAATHDARISRENGLQSRFDASPMVDHAEDEETPLEELLVSRASGYSCLRLA